MKKVELLAPAKNKETAIAAINCGADAVYIGQVILGQDTRQATISTILKRLLNTLTNSTLPSTLRLTQF